MRMQSRGGLWSPSNAQGTWQAVQRFYSGILVASYIIIVGRAE